MSGRVKPDVGLTGTSPFMINYRILIFLSIAVMASALGQGLVVPLLPIYAQSLGAGGFTIGLIFGAFSVSRTALLPYFGNLSDRKGRKIFITSGLFFYFMTSIAFTYSDSATLLITTRFFQGIAAAMILPVTQAYGGEIAPDGKEGYVMGIINFGFYLGLSLGPVFGGIIKDTYGMNASFVGMGIVCFSGFLLCQIFLPPQRQEKLLTTRKAPENLRILLKDVSIVALFIMRLAQIMCVGTLWTFVPVLADRQFQMSSSSIGIVITLIVALSAAIMPITSILADRMEKRILVILGSSIIVVAICVLVFADELWAVYTAAILAGIGGGISTPAQMGMAAVLGKQHHSLGSIMSLLTLGHSIGMFFGPVITGAAIDFLGIRAGFIVSGITLLVVVLIFFPMTSRYRDLQTYPN